MFQGEDTVEQRIHGHQKRKNKHCSAKRNSSHPKGKSLRPSNNGKNSESSSLPNPNLMLGPKKSTKEKGPVNPRKKNPIDRSRGVKQKKHHIWMKKRKWRKQVNPKGQVVNPQERGGGGCD